MVSIIEWKNPPYGIEDQAEEVARELNNNPGAWALVLQDSTKVEELGRELEKLGVETRMDAREMELGHPHYRTWVQGDLYARY